MCRAQGRKRCLIYHNFNISTELTVTIDVDYTAPSDFVGGPNDYRAASTVTLTCQVTGGKQMVTYSWTSTCSTRCFIHSKTSQTVRRITLQSIDSGTHTCTATCGGLIESATIEMNIVGE